MTPTRAGKHGGMEGPTPWWGPAVFLGFGSQRVSGSLAPQGLLGPVPLSLWSDLQQRCDHLPRTLVSHQEKQGVEAVLNLSVHDQPSVVDVAHNVWHLEGHR